MYGLRKKRLPRAKCENSGYALFQQCNLAISYWPFLVVSERAYILQIDGGMEIFSYLSSLLYACLAEICIFYMHVSLYTFLMIFKLKKALDCDRVRQEGPFRSTRICIKSGCPGSTSFVLSCPGICIGACQSILLLLAIVCSTFTVRI